MATSPKKLQLILNDIFSSIFSFIGLLPIFSFFSLCVIVLLALILTVASDLGSVTTLSCKRIEPTTVNCTRKRSVFFGLIQQKPTSLFMVTEAKLKSEVIKIKKNWTREDNSVTLVTKQGEYTVFDRERGKTEMKVFADRIQAFINSTESSLILKQDLRRNWGEHIISLIFLFALSLTLYVVGRLWLIFAFLLGLGLFILLTNILMLLKKIFRIS